MSFQFKALFPVLSCFISGFGWCVPFFHCSYIHTLWRSASAVFFLWSIYHFIPRDVDGVLSCARSLNSKLAKFNKMSTQNQLRSNRLDLIRSQMLRTSPLCLFTLTESALVKAGCEKNTTRSKWEKERHTEWFTTSHCSFYRWKMNGVHGIMCCAMLYSVSHSIRNSILPLCYSSTSICRQFHLIFATSPQFFTFQTLCEHNHTLVCMLLAAVVIASRNENDLRQI